MTSRWINDSRRRTRVEAGRLTIGRQSNPALLLSSTVLRPFVTPDPWQSCAKGLRERRGSYARTGQHRFTFLSNHSSTTCTMSRLSFSIISLDTLVLNADKFGLNAG
jgi:hypothetical protein